MKQTSKIYFTILVVVSTVVAGFAQHPEAKRATHWYFGNGAGLDFSSGSPVAVTNGALHTFEGCATMSDTAGNLLFYTDGDTVWNRNHQPMPNGTGLMGCHLYGSSAQATLIVPQPKHDSLYYVFTIDCAENLGTSELRYSLVNINLNNGLGDIVSTNKNILLDSNFTEGLTGIKICDSIIWILTHKVNTNSFFVYKISKNGLDVTPIISNVGSIYNDFVVYMRFSPNGSMIASSYTYGDEVYLFDKQNGIVHSPINLPFSTTPGYCPNFSEDSKKLYFTNNGYEVYQYDLSVYNLSAINNSKILVSDSIPFWDNSSYWAISNAINGKMYIANYGMDSISTIQNPTFSGLNCGFNKNNIYLSGKNSQIGLPDFIQSYFNASEPELCTDTVPYNPNDSEPTLIIPNIFTPNNDGINDVFSIVLSGYENIAWKIYNRWGSEMINGKLEMLNNGVVELWDGRTNAGEQVPDGTYYYSINLTKKGDENETKKGFITLSN